jgi:pentatricopeptide repeat protein
MSGATHLVPSARRPPTTPHLFLPPFVPDVPKEPTSPQKDAFFLPQVQIQTPLIRSEPLSTIFSPPELQSNSFFLKDQLAETFSDAVKSVQTLSAEIQLHEKCSIRDSTGKALDKELQAELSLQYSSLESLQRAEADERKIVSDPSRPNPFVYIQLMKHFSGIGNIGEVLRLFSEMRYSNCDVNVLCYNTVMNALLILGRPKDSQDLFDEMLQSGVAPNVASFNILVKLHCWFSNKFDLAYEVMAKMKEFGFRPDSTTYSTVITGLCKANRLEEAWGLLDLMIEEQCMPTVCTYTPIVEGYCLQRKIEEAKELMATMESLGCTPNTVTYNILIRALCDAGRFDEVEKVLEESQTKGWIPNTITYNTYMNGLCQKSMSKQAIEKLQIMLNKGLKPTNVTIGILINCLCRDSNFLLVQNLLQKNQILDCSVGVIGYNTLMSRLSGIGSWWVVLQLLTDMFKMGIHPNPRTFNIVVNSLCRGGKFSIAKVLFTCRGFVRNTVAYNTILHWSFLEGRSNDSQVILSNMAMEDIAPDEITYGIIVNGLCREGKFAEATVCFLESLATGVSGNRISDFVNRLVKNRKLKEILQLFEGMRELGHLLDSFIFDLTIRTFCRHRRCVRTDMFMLCLVLDKMLEETHKVHS